MSQGYAIELYFDPALENQVLKAWNVLARRQISTHLIEIESRPHITLYSSSFAEPTKLESIVKNFASKQEPLSLSLSAIGGLPNDNNVLFLAPTPSLSLLQFHSQLYDALKKEGIEITEDYRPDSWIPYCAVAQDVPKARIGEAFCVLRDLKLPLQGFAHHLSETYITPEIGIVGTIQLWRLLGPGFDSKDVTLSVKELKIQIQKSQLPNHPAGVISLI
ncbi:hypothetical protein GH714_010973 [Hevea brasiliensis]|uniref:Uncharacterized protein n=1 Tax=Hevea brasiliensis TaxID=3981 RepID=A0A6A6M8J8_HEVBR|nr:hypothetical protein GH714_010973 [Hevea brasiliensis]